MCSFQIVLYCKKYFFMVYCKKREGGVFLENKVLVATLAICTAVCTVIADYAYTGEVQDERYAEALLYEQLNADPHMLYGGYTVEQLGAGYEKPVPVFGKTLVEVPVINQFPELPVGCEPVCAVSVLNYLGFDIGKSSFVDGYVRWDDGFTIDEENISYGPDPNKIFAGDPYGWGYGCYAPVIVEAMNGFFADNGSRHEAISLENVNEADIEKLLDEGVPLIVWASRGMKPYKFREPAQWIIRDTGEEFTWIGNSHTLVLCGYDGNCYYFMDCDDKSEITAYSKESFLNRFEENGSQCIAVKILNT